MTRQLASASPVKSQHPLARGAARSEAASSRAERDPLARLYRALGNRGVAQLLQASPRTAAGTSVGIQPKLTVGPANDEYEQQAERVANEVMSIPDTAAVRSGQRAVSSEEDPDRLRQTSSLAASITPFVQRYMVSNAEWEDDDSPIQPCCVPGHSFERQRQAQPEEDEDRAIQPRSAGPRAGFEAGAAVEAQIDASRGRGSALPDAVRAFMEPRFGIDFTDVRVHTGGVVDEMNQAIRARAFTHGSDIYYGAGYSPADLPLTAHELTHVVQQAGGAPAALQRDPKPDEKAVAQDVAALLSPDKDFVTLANAIAPGAKVLHATSVEDLAKQLKGLKGPIGTLYFVAHMDEDGDLLFTAPSKLDYVPAAKIAEQLKGSVQVANIDLRGCSVAQAPAEINKIRVALKATRVTGSTCALVKQIGNPIEVLGKAITRPEQLNDKKVKTAFDQGFKLLREKFVDARKKCIINDSTDGYFQNGGRLIALWVNPESMADPSGWDDNKSICYKDLKLQKVDPTKKLPVIGPDDCKLVEVSQK